jgi:8-oxo-dGTP pyrophosphatase MutT (NUDIX family)
MTTRFTAFHPVSEHDFGAVPAPGFALIIARAPKGVVLVLNSMRKVWELPGGFIDPGETPRAAAIRELAEEAGCVAREPRWLGITEVDDGQPRFGALLDCQVERVPEEFSSSETLAIGYWRRDLRPWPLAEADDALLGKFA